VRIAMKYFLYNSLIRR